MDFNTSSKENFSLLSTLNLSENHPMSSSYGNQYSGLYPNTDPIRLDLDLDLNYHYHHFSFDQSLNESSNDKAYANSLSADFGAPNAGGLLVPEGKGFLDFSIPIGGPSLFEAPINPPVEVGDPYGSPPAKKGGDGLESPPEEEEDDDEEEEIDIDGSYPKEKKGQWSEIEDRYNKW